tara:strand:- start:1157 stop:1813 length:657 start_codon:yes stop_codon:yes gene_type:complete
MQTSSRQIESNQTGPHDRLQETVLKHVEKPFLKPIADHTQRVFDQIQTQLDTLKRPMVFDSCCGVGDSSRALAKEYPDHWVIGIDKSANRLAREREGGQPENLIMARADLNDFYRLAQGAGWRFDRHYILYPNPWPKSVHLGKRWHGAPVFPVIAALGGKLELRSNWKLYLEEFAIALGFLDHTSELAQFVPEKFLTAFEKKFHESDQPLWRLTANLA